jgi:hypothetical protein
MRISPHALEPSSLRDLRDLRARIFRLFSAISEESIFDLSLGKTGSNGQNSAACFLRSAFGRLGILERLCLKLWSKS